MKKLFSFLCVCLALISTSLYADTPTIKAGVLKFGTVNWELKVIKDYGLDQAEGFNLEVVPFAGKQASTTALLGGAVDVIVNDWIWVSRQRSEGRSFSFVPYSRMVGALMAAPDKGVKSLADLKGKKLGIAGGPVDKSWLLFQAVAQQEFGLDLKASVDAVFGAPPLLAKKLEMGELDAVINFWHYAAKLESKGFHRVMDVSQALELMKVDVNVPMIGYVFSPEYSEKTQLIEALSRASRKAKDILAADDQAWVKLKPVMKAKTDAMYQALKSGFLAGIPQKWGSDERNQAKVLFELLADKGGEKLVGKSKALAPGTFVESVTY